MKPFRTISIRPTIALLLSGVVLLPGLWLADAGAATPEHDQRQSPAGRVVARVQVDGDRRRDTVRYQVITDDLVKVTVETARGRVDSMRLRTYYWPRGKWQGAARIDGRRGAELVVGTSTGAHALLFSVLTWRGGELTRERAPGGGREWLVDAAYNDYYGWLRTRTDGGAAQIIERYVTREGTSHRWSGRAISYTWRSGDWRRSSKRSLSYRGDRNASRVYGWKVKGLKRGY